MEPSDEALLDAMAAGDAQAAAVLVRRYQVRVFGLCLAVLGARSLAEEVAQDTFVRAWRFAGGYDSRRGAVITWLLAIARNAAIDAHRSRLERPYDPDEVLAMLDSRAANDEPEQLTDAAHVRTALRTLPLEQARAVLMANFYGLTAREIAEREQVPLGTAKTRIRRGLIRLRDELGVSDD